MGYTFILASLTSIRWIRKHITNTLQTFFLRFILISSSVGCFFTSSDCSAGSFFPSCDRLAGCFFSSSVCSASGLELEPSSTPCGPFTFFAEFASLCFSLIFRLQRFFFWGLFLLLVLWFVSCFRHIWWVNCLVGMTVRQRGPEVDPLWPSLLDRSGFISRLTSLRGFWRTFVGADTEVGKCW